MEKMELEKGHVVQISPEEGVASNPQFGGCIAMVDEPKPWGAQVFVQVPGQGQAYYRAEWKEMELVGMAPWVPDGSDE